jgi:transcriptional regulator with XRE-family HTH domain
MGRSRRPRPSRLASKLLQIRLTLGLTQQQMFEQLNYQKSPLLPPHISDFELDKREPSLAILLCYARMAGLALEVLADDGLDLPARFSSQSHLTQSKERIVVFGQCPYCEAVSKQIKAGRNRSGSRRYQCRHCLRHYTPQPIRICHPNRVLPVQPFCF